MVVALSLILMKVFTWVNGKMILDMAMELIDGKKPFKIIMLTARRDGSVYEGNWEDDQRSGLGSMTWADGQRYIGNWKNGRKEGRGEEIWSDGRKYVGEYKNSNMHGNKSIHFFDFLK
jgi:hypothetical protein